MPTQYQTKKRFGQHFLHDQNILDKIVSAISPQQNDLMVEIGPGQGVLSTRLMQRLERLTAIEIDTDLLAQLETIQHPGCEFNLIGADALKFDYSSLTEEKEQLRIVGNLPYNISTPLLFGFIQHAKNIRDMHFLLQKEVVDRLAAMPATKDYGRLSVMVQYHCKVTRLFQVPPGAFKPPPKVDSAVVRLIPLQPLSDVANDYTLFSRLVKTAFSQRRKMLRKSLAQLAQHADFITADIAPQRRPETLSVKEFVNLANAIKLSN